MFVSDAFSLFINIVVLAGAILSVLVSSNYLQSRGDIEAPGSMPFGGPDA
jgi:hypothetical protein